MIVLRVELVAGTYHATDHTLRSAEWPPHPDRVFQALVASLHRNGNPDGARKAVEAIERASWSITFSEAKPRSLAKQFVPRNEDPASGKQGYCAVMRTERMKERFLPVTEPVEPVLHFYIDADASREELRPLVEDIARLGRSPVVATVRAADVNAQPTIEPVAEPSDLLLRVPYKGRLADLETAFEQGSKVSVSWKWYRRTRQASREAKPTGEFRDFVVLGASGRGVDGVRTAPLLDHARRAVLSICDDPLPSWLTGHDADRSPLDDSHLALAPMIFSGRHGDGRIMGIGLLLPSRVDATEARDRLQPLLQKGIVIADQHWHIDNVRGATMEPITWTRPSRTWATVTPLEIRHRDRRPALEIIQDWTKRAKLPQPVAARLRGTPFLSGPDHARRYAQGKHPRLRVHALVEWDTPIRGPIAIGMGRFRGFGLMRPLVSEQGATHA